jgi:mutator protein MutT
MKSKKEKPGKDYIGVGGGTLILNEKLETLLLKRSINSKNEAGFWNKPGGSVEFGETVEDALKRETMEELGVEVKMVKFLSYTDHFVEKENEHWIAFNFIAKIIKGTPRIMEPHKADDMRWFKLTELPEKTSQPTLEAVKQALEIKNLKELISEK